MKILVSLVSILIGIFTSRLYGSFEIFYEITEKHEAFYASTSPESFQEAKKKLNRNLLQCQRMAQSIVDSTSDGSLTSEQLAGAAKDLNLHFSELSTSISEWRTLIKKVRDFRSENGSDIRFLYRERWLLNELEDEDFWSQRIESVEKLRNRAVSSLESSTKTLTCISDSFNGETKSQRCE